MNKNLSITKERYRDQLNDETEKLEVYKKNHAGAKQESLDLEDKIQNSEKKIELKEKRKGLLRQLKSAKDEYDKFLDGINSRFFDGNFSWLAMGLDEIPSLFSMSKYKYLDIISEKKALNRLKNNPEELNLMTLFSKLENLNLTTWNELENMDDSEIDSFVRILIKTIEEYANAGFSYLQSQFDEDRNPFNQTYIFADILKDLIEDKVANKVL